MRLLSDAAGWEKEWKAVGEAAASKLKKAGIDRSRTFDSKAEAFNKQSFSAEGRKRTERIISWLEGRGVSFSSASVLDVGAASGVFSVPFAERGAHVTAIETSPPQVALLKGNLERFGVDKSRIVSEPFEAIDVQARGWGQAFDLVFASMCPIIADWDSVEKLIQCARQFCYISLPAGIREHSLTQEIWPLLTDQPFKDNQMDFGYLPHLLFLKGYAYETLVTREVKTYQLSKEAALKEVMSRLHIYGLSSPEQHRAFIADYLEKTYPSGSITVQDSGRYGKVLIRLQDQSMPG